MSSATFLVLLLALSSGYNITRNTLDGHRAKVILVPSIVFIAGVVSYACYGRPCPCYVFRAGVLSLASALPQHNSCCIALVSL